MVYTIEALYSNYNYVPGNTGERSDNEGCDSYQQDKYTCNEDTYDIIIINIAIISIRPTVPVC